jgi:hypothetical protein
MAADGSDEKLLKAVQGKFQRLRTYSYVNEAKFGPEPFHLAAFNPYDLYSKDDEDGMDVDKLWSYYEDLITEFFPNGEIEW